MKTNLTTLNQMCAFMDLVHAAKTSIKNNKPAAFPDINPNRARLAALADFVLGAANDVAEVSSNAFTHKGKTYTRRDLAAVLLNTMARRELDAEAPNDEDIEEAATQVRALVDGTKAAMQDPAKRMPGFEASRALVQAVAKAAGHAEHLIIKKDSKGYHYSTPTRRIAARWSGKEVIKYFLNIMARAELKEEAYKRAAAEARTEALREEAAKSSEAFWTAVNTTADVSTKTAHAGSPFKVTAMGALVWHGKSVSPGSHILVTMLRRMVILEKTSELYHAFATLSRGGTWRG